LTGDGGEDGDVVPACLTAGGDRRTDRGAPDTQDEAVRPRTTDHRYNQSQQLHWCVLEQCY